MRFPIGGLNLLGLSILSHLSFNSVDCRSTGYQPKGAPKLLSGTKAEGRHLRCKATAMSLRAEPKAAPTFYGRVSCVGHGAGKMACLQDQFVLHREIG